MGLTSISRVLLVCISINSMQQTGAIKMKIDDVDVSYVNGEFVDENTFDISVNYINATYNSLRCKAIVIKKFPEDSRIVLKVYGYAFGNYRMPTGITIDVSICDIKSKPVFMAPFVTAIGGDLNKCGPDLGEYGNGDFFPVNLDMLPTAFPPNKYRLDVELGNRDTTIGKVQFFISVSL